MLNKQKLKVGLVSVSDRASQGVYADQGIPALQAWLEKALIDTLAVADREMPGFGEQMRQVSLQFVPTAILSRQVGVIRGESLILNLPGQPKAIQETLEGVKDENGKTIVKGIFSAVPYCLQLLSEIYIDTHASVCESFRPKSARR